MPLYATASQYAEEHKLFSLAYALLVTDAEADLIVRKICHHFKVGAPPIYFRGNRQSGICYRDRVGLSHNPSVGLILHELAHWCHDRKVIASVHQRPNVGTSHHGLHFEMYRHQLHEFAKLYNYWVAHLAAKREKANVADAKRTATGNDITPLVVKPWAGFKEGSVAGATLDFIKTRETCSLQDVVEYVSRRYNKDLRDVNALVTSYLIDWSRGSWGGSLRAFPFTITVSETAVTYKAKQ